MHAWRHMTASAAQVLYTDKSKWSGALPDNDALDRDAARLRGNSVSSARPDRARELRL